MSFGANKEAVTEPAPAISPDFLTGSTEIGLERIRTRLLDLTNRNKLLNFKHTPASSLRVVDVGPDAVFKLLRDHQKLTFLPVPEPDGVARRDGLPAKDHAAFLGWNTSFDLTGQTDEGSDILPVLLYHEQLDTLSRKIASAAKTAIEESGANMLFLIFGFLEWFESDDSDQSHLAPLVVLPVTVERNGIKGRAVEAVLQYSGEDIETNLSLVEKMRRDFGLEIPPLDDEDGPDTYFAKFGPILNLKKRWAVRRHMTLALLSFGKLLMYRDLDPKTWPKGESIATHPLVRELFEGTKHPSIEMAEEFAIDMPELAKEVPHLIRDADSSQHSALIHALRGQNLVIEGPPGTGKSQTITNLIAAALARGKTVLFVAEKLAALQVVRSRLDDAGLGIFCLEVHSHKTQKGALLKDLEHRYSLRGSLKDPRDLDRHLAVIEEKKATLTQYAGLVNKTIEPFGATVFDILWARDRCSQDTAALKPLLGTLILPDTVRFTRTQFSQAEQFLDVYAQHLAAALAPAKLLDRHPWAWIENPLLFDEEERVIALLGEFVSVMADCERQCDQLQSRAGVSLNRTPSGLRHASSLLAFLPAAEGPILAELLPSCQSRENREALNSFCGHIAAFHHAFDTVSAITDNASALMEPALANELTSACDSLTRWGLETVPITELKQLLITSADTARLLSEINLPFQTLLSAIGCEAPVTLSSATFLLETVRILESAPFALLHLRLPAFEQEQAIPTLQAAQREAAALRQTEQHLGRQFDMTVIPDVQNPDRLLEHAAIVEKTSWWGRVFGPDYRKSVKAYRRLCHKPARTTRAQMAVALRSVAQHAQARTRFDGNQTYRSTFGAYFQGLNSPWEDLQKVILWCDQVFVALPQHQPICEPFRRLILTARVEQLKAIHANLPASDEVCKSLQQVLWKAAEFVKAVPSQGALTLGSLDQLAQNIDALCQECGRSVAALERASIKGTFHARDVKISLPAAKLCRDETTEIINSGVVQRLLGLFYRGSHTDTAPIKATVQFAHAVASGSFPPPTIEWLLIRDYAPRLRDLRAWLTGVKESISRLHTLRQEIASSASALSWNDLAQDSWGSLLARAQYSLSHRDELTPWQHFLRVRAKSKESGLDRLTALADSGSFLPKDIGAAFRFCFYNTLARSVFTEHAELSHVTGLTQEQLQSQFSSADREAIRLYSQRVAALIDQRPIPAGNQSGPVRSWTDMALINNEIRKQVRHIPIRQLIHRSANALVALKPCFMMGPLSVAQYLAPGQLKFDLVVMDEASQLKPEDAIGALARAGQVVVVGDPKQLPPTSFFQRVNLDAEDEPAADDRMAVEEGESILDVASTLFQPVRRLRWHYRSRHHSLIAFSNNEFYRDLIIFPSAYHDHPSLGVKHRYIADGKFEGRRNAREAEVVVAAVLDHMREHPDESLGIVTLNFEQRELVEELLDKRLRDDPAAIAYQERMTGGQETLFIKNLENVQGDERDVIFISTTYGPDARGNQYQRFGPINGPQGHRRLNVLFTRSKKRTVVFSSLDPDQIQTTSSSSWGLRALKKYLIFARTGILQQADDGLEQEANDFECSVSSVLKEHGYDVAPQVGVAGFFIDLAVKHPNKPGAFLVGIECDGASYHSGRSARDRDRLRQEILENLGWKI